LNARIREVRKKMRRVKERMEKQERKHAENAIEITENENNGSRDKEGSATARVLSSGPPRHLNEYVSE
jgi:hypothetical protein